jgi:hypothetical protein
MKLDSLSLKFDYLSYYWVTPLDSEQESDQYQKCNHGVCHVKLILRASAVLKVTPLVRQYMTLLTLHDVLPTPEVIYHHQCQCDVQY